MDEEERVRVLQGIRLSENVVNCMKDSNQPSKVGQPFPPASPPSTLGTCKGPEKDSKLPRLEYGGSQPPSGVEEDLLRRYKQEQAVVQDELFQVVTREREAATKYWSAFLHRGEGSVDQEKQKSALLARELEYQKTQLKCHNTFYKEQLEHIERKEDTSPHRPVSLTPTSYLRTEPGASPIKEACCACQQLSYDQKQALLGVMMAECCFKGMQMRPHRLQPVCSGLQAQILRCYSNHLPEVLLCSDLVKAYQHCVTTAHKG